MFSALVDEGADKDADETASEVAEDGGRTVPEAADATVSGVVPVDDEAVAAGGCSGCVRYPPVAVGLA